MSDAPASRSTSDVGAMRMPIAVKIITPVCVDSADIDRRERRYAAAGGPDVRVRVFNMPGGPSKLAVEDDLRKSDDGALRVGLETNSDEFDAILFDCVFDRGLDPLRGKTSVPVFGPMSFTLSVLPQIASRFSVIVRTAAHRDLLLRSLKKTEEGRRLGRVDLLGISDDESRDPQRYDAAMVPIVSRLASEDPTQALLLGSTTMDITPAIRLAAKRMKLIHPSLFTLDAIVSLAKRGALAPRLNVRDS